ncbi:SusC/RagA family TonB-linked outer membrane protein [Emticicia sp.]|uniref:SusC/RagA family TonB-linked outer membrane protein n=1 Tax=Emticicia sp. TaxID=1930953 RepID=UPI00374FFFD6
MKKTLQLFFFFWAILAIPSFAQEKSVTGKVTADDGSTLPGVTVTIKGTTKGTNTDVDGNFRISVPNNGRLVFSYVGFTSQEINVGNQSTINVSLMSSNETLNEVVVTTFGTAKKTSFTGSAATISAEKIGPRPITNIGQALAGVSAGVQATVGSGQPGTAPAIRIRGFGSISSSNDPLYVVDGVPYSASIANLNSDDIETITVLKDAASTALYGARAANGVVMVTTKKGAKGKNNISVRYTKGFNSRGLQEYERVGPADYYPLMWEANRNNFAYRVANPIAIATASTNATNNLGSIVGYNVYNVPFNQLVGTDGKLNPSATMIYSADDLNWEKPLMRQGNRDEINISFSGSAEKSDYFLSLSYLKDKGFLIRSDYDRYTARLNVNNQIKSWFKVGTNLSTTIIKSNQADADGNTNFVNPFFFSRGMAPIYPVYAFDPANPSTFLLNEDGTKKYDFGNLSALGLPNRPQNGGRHSLAETVLNQNFFRRNVVGGRGYAEISFLKDFKFTTNLGVDITNVNNITYGNPIVGDGAPAGRATHIFENITSYNLSQLLNYNKSLGSHSIGVLLGHENYNETDNRLNGSRSGQILDGNIELLNFTTTTNLDSRRRDRRVEGYFSRINYDFNEKYFASFSARRDGSSKFYKDTRWGTFYSVSAAWRLDQEAFIKELPFISTLKLRGSYGQTGNDGDISRYAWQPLYDLGANNATEAGILQSSLGNRELEWESSNAFDIALEFGLLKNRINGTIEYFDRRSSNLIFDVPLPLSAGIITQTRNIGTMFNKGVELELDIALVRSKDFSWNINLNATKLKNQITKMPDASKEIIQGTKKLKEGQSIFDFWLRDFNGINPETGVVEYRAINFVPANSRITETGDTLTNVVSNARFHYNGSSIPLVSGAITNTIKYKGLSLSALVIYQLGGKTYDGAYASLMSTGYNNAKHIDILNRWQNPGDITSVPRMDAGRTADFDAASDRWLIDASYLNVRTVTLAYTIPSRASKKVFLENAQIYASAENFIILSRRNGMNVQQNFDGVTSNAFSPAKSIVLGVSFSL